MNGNKGFIFCKLSRLVLGLGEYKDMGKIKSRSASVYRSLKTTSFDVRGITMGH